MTYSKAIGVGMVCALVTTVLWIVGNVLLSGASGFLPLFSVTQIVVAAAIGFCVGVVWTIWRS